MFGLFSKALFSSKVNEGATGATNEAAKAYMKKGLMFVDWKTPVAKNPLEWRKSKADMEDRNIFKRGQRGLFGGKIIGFGNNVSFSERKTRRTWKPNVQKDLWSDLQNRFISIKLTMYVLRWIDKVGGLDNYLLYTSPRKLASDYGMKLKLEMIELWEKKNGRKFDAQQEINDARVKGVNLFPIMKKAEKKSKKKEDPNAPKTATDTATNVANPTSGTSVPNAATSTSTTVPPP